MIRFDRRPYRRIALVVSVAAAAILAFVANYYAATFIDVGSLTFAVGDADLRPRLHPRRLHPSLPRPLGDDRGRRRRRDRPRLAFSFAFGGGLGRIVLASLTSLVVASSVDIRVQTALLSGPIWRLVLVSNAISLLVDTFVFTLLAFYGVDGVAIPNLIAGDYLVKLVMDGHLHSDDLRRDRAGAVPAPHPDAGRVVDVWSPGGSRAGGQTGSCAAPFENRPSTVWCARAVSTTHVRVASLSVGAGVADRPGCKDMTGRGPSMAMGLGRRRSGAGQRGSPLSDC